MTGDRPFLWTMVAAVVVCLALVATLLATGCRTADESLDTDDSFSLDVRTVRIKGSCIAVFSRGSWQHPALAAVVVPCPLTQPQLVEKPL